MTNTVAPEQTVLKITRTFHAPKAKVFEAWTTPGVLKQWFGPSAEFTVAVADVDLRVGGNYRLQMIDPGGESHTAIGTYREITRPEKLVFTWSWEAGHGCDGEPMPEMGETLVTVEFLQKDDDTEMTLTHELFPDAQTRDKHNEGWTGCLARLEKVV